jgi:hypothetical protein
MTTSAGPRTTEAEATARLHAGRHTRSGGEGSRCRPSYPHFWGSAVDKRNARQHRPTSPVHRGGDRLSRGRDPGLLVLIAELSTVNGTTNAPAIGPPPQSARMKSLCCRWASRVVSMQRGPSRVPGASQMTHPDDPPWKFGSTLTEERVTGASPAPLSVCTSGHHFPERPEPSGCAGRAWR